MFKPMNEVLQTEEAIAIAVEVAKDASKRMAIFLHQCLDNFF